MLRYGLIAYLCTFSLYASESTNEIINKIKALESDRDPKCYATASRLEDFIFGTPLTPEARFEKNAKQKELAALIWKDASSIAKKKRKPKIEVSEIREALNNKIETKRNAKGHWDVYIEGAPIVQVHKDDKRQYSTIAYSLRAILAVQQELLLGTLNEPLLPMNGDSVSELKDALDFYTLVVLKIADEKARKDSEYEISKLDLVSTWEDLLPNLSNKQLARSLTDYSNANFDLLRQTIQQKLASYKKYNNVNNQIFVRNLQVYFARNKWPKDEQQARQFRRLFTETLIQFAKDLYTGSEKLAIKNNRSSITERDVYQFAQIFIPHTINEYEDAIFFPNLDKNEQVIIESYDMDAFRDSGLHWQYLGFAVDDKGFQASLELDPFAAELLAENIAQFGVLILRMTGEEGRAKKEDRISIDHFYAAGKKLQDKVNRHGTAKKEETNNRILSSGNEDPIQKMWFTDVTGRVRIDVEHRSSDWLNRLLRSYLKKDENTGIITIPPAFGGAGVAAEDIDNDGYIDLLILSGAGNKLLLNNKDGSFRDVTREAGLGWVRDSDNLPGEPRQPIIADLNNDGNQDIIITYVDDSHRVYKNLGAGKFEDVTNKASLGGEGLVGGPATVFDYDNDGDLDLYIAYFGNYLKGVLPTLKRKNFNGLPNKLFENTGNFTFKDVSANSGVENTGWGQAVTHTDLNGDGWQDLIVGNDFGVNAYYINNKDGTFKDIAQAIGTDKPSYTMGIGLSDLNGDLTPDIYISNIVTMNKDEKYVLPTKDTPAKFNPNNLSKMRIVEANDLFLSRIEDGMLVYDHSYAVERGDYSTGWSWDADFFDVDNDGDDDLYVLNGINEFNLYSSENPYYQDPLSNQSQNIYIPVSNKETNVFFLNDSGKLRNMSKHSGLDYLGNSRSAAYLDYDNDGDLDVVVNNYHDKVKFYDNQADALNNNWLKVKLVGNPDKKVSRDAIGARIIIETEGGNLIWREVSATIGYMSVHPKVQHVGLGKDRVKKLFVEWPNGEISTYEKIEHNQTVEVTQK